MLLTTKHVQCLPPIETTPIILIRFTSKATPEFVRLVKERLIEGRFLIVTEEKDNDKNVMFGVSTTQEELELEAEHLNLVKPSALKNMSDGMTMFEGTIIMEAFQVADRDSFVREKDPNDHLEVYDASGIFTSADRVKIMNSLLESISVLKPSATSSNLSRKLNETLKFPANEIEARYHKLYLFDTLRNDGLIDVHAPLHATHLKNNICAALFNLRLEVPLQALRAY